MFKSLLALGLFIFSVPAFSAVVGKVNVYSYSSGNVSTSAYTVLLASMPYSSSHLEICDSSGHLLKIATGATGSEMDVASVPISGCIIVPLYIAAGTQISIKAIDANATTGFNVISIQ